MPIYEYTCKSCDKSFEHLHRSMNGAATDKIKCPECGSTKTARALSVFAAVSSQGKSSASAPATGCGRCGSPNPCPSGY